MSCPRPCAHRSTWYFSEISPAQGEFSTLHNTRSQFRVVCLFIDDNIFFVVDCECLTRHNVHLEKFGGF